MATTPKRLEVATTHVRALKDDIREEARLRATAPAPPVAMKRRRLLTARTGKAYAVHWAGNSRDVAVATQDGIRVWNADDGIPVCTVAKRSSWLMACAYETKSDAYVACGGLDNVCAVYQVGSSATSPMLWKELFNHDGYVTCCRFVGGSEQLLTSSGDCTCILWDVGAGVPKVHFHGHTEGVMFVAVSPTDTNLFVSGSSDGRALVWDCRTGASVQAFSHHDSDITAVAFIGGSGTAFGTASEDATIRLLDLRCSGQLNVLQRPEAPQGVSALDFSRSGRLCFGGSHDCRIRVWDTLEDHAVTPLQELTPHTDRVTGVQVAPSGQAVASSSYDTCLAVCA